MSLRTSRTRRSAAVFLSLAHVGWGAAACSSDPDSGAADNSVAASSASLAQSAWADGDAAAYPGTVATKFGDFTVEEAPRRVVALGWGDAEVALSLGVESIAAADWLSFGGGGVGPWVEHGYTQIWRDPETQKQRTKRGFSSARSAQVWAAKMLVDQVQGSWVDPQWGRTPMSTIIAAWHEAKSLSRAPSSARSNGTYIRHRTTPRWGTSAVGKISRSGVQEWVNSLYAEDGLSGKTVRIIYGLFSAIMEYAVQEGYIPKSPCQGIVLPKKTHPGRYILLLTRLNDLLKNVLGTGTRFGFWLPRG